MANPRGKGFSKVSKLRRKLRRLPDEINKDIRRAMQDSANSIHRDAARMAPVSDPSAGNLVIFKGKKTGARQEHLRDIIKTDIGRDGLSARIGFWKKGNKRLWQRGGWRAHFVLFGTKGGTIKSGPFAGAVIPPQPANNFLFKALRQNVNAIRHRIDKAVNKALRRAANQ